MGVVAPNANTLGEFELALRKGRSGIHHCDRMRDLNFSCQVAGIPEGIDELAASYFAEHQLLSMDTIQRYVGIAATDAWQDAGLPLPDSRDGQDEKVDWDTGAVVGTGIGGLEVMTRVRHLIDAGKVRRLGSSIVEQAMASGVSARVGGLFNLGNQVTTNSSACTSGTEAIIQAAQRIQSGSAIRMITGGAEDANPYVWAGFDAMRVLARGYNDAPSKASRPLSASTAGFVPGAGAGILILEKLETALDRGASIYGELLGGYVNSGGQCGGGSMTAPNPEGVVRCIRGALLDAGVQGQEIDAINGHFTATYADPREVAGWAHALERTPDDFPALTATKSMIGHALGAAGAIECVASLLMLKRGFLHPCLNAEELHPEIEPYASSIPRQAIEEAELRTIIKAGFGFGDVNGCVVFRKWND